MTGPRPPEAPTPPATPPPWPTALSRPPPVLLDPCLYATAVRAPSPVPDDGTDLRAELGQRERTPPEDGGLIRTQHRAAIGETHSSQDARISSTADAARGARDGGAATLSDGAADALPALLPGRDRPPARRAGARRTGLEADGDVGEVFHGKRFACNGRSGQVGRRRHFALVASESCAPPLLTSDNVLLSEPMATQGTTSDNVQLARHLARLSPAYVEPPLPDDEQEAAAAYVDAARSPNTLRAYAADCRAFATWCEARGVRPMPASGTVLAGYIAHMAEHGARPSSIDRALSAISQRHEAAGLPSPRTDPLVRAARKGIRRTVGTAPEQKTPLRLPELRAALAALPPGPIGTRDRALLLVGWGAALRRAELVALDVADVRITGEGVEVRIRRSKTDQAGAGAVVRIARSADPATCAGAALLAWIALLDAPPSGPLFRSIHRGGRVSPRRLSDRSAAEIVKAAAGRLGLDPATFGGHSLRAGWATEAAALGKRTDQLQAVGRWKSAAMALRYTRDADGWAATRGVL